jgi:hypothetical protein
MRNTNQAGSMDQYGTQLLLFLQQDLLSLITDLFGGLWLVYAPEFSA